MPKSTYPAVDLLWEKYSYCPFTGNLYKRKSGIHVKGFLTSNKRSWNIHLTWNGNRIHTSYGRVVYAWCHGFWPIHDIDHVNNNFRDNRIHNLREVTVRQNNQNRRVFNGGASKDPRRPHRWYARIQVNGYQKRLGTYASEEEAQAAYVAACAALELACLPELLNKPLPKVDLPESLIEHLWERMAA